MKIVIASQKEIEVPNGDFCQREDGSVHCGNYAYDIDPFMGAIFHCKAFNHNLEVPYDNKPINAKRNIKKCESCKMCESIIKMEVKEANDGENGRCKVLDTYIEGEHIPRICPLKSLEQHDNEVRREFAEKVKASVCENAYTVYYDKFSSDNGMTEDGFNELIDNLQKQHKVDL